MTPMITTVKYYLECTTPERTKAKSKPSTAIGRLKNKRIKRASASSAGALIEEKAAVTSGENNLTHFEYDAQRREKTKSKVSERASE